MTAGRGLGPGMRTRRESRERALSLCYELDVRGLPLEDLLADLPADPDPYALELARGVEEHREEIDALIRKFADRWSLEPYDGLACMWFEIDRHGLREGQSGRVGSAGA